MKVLLIAAAVVSSLYGNPQRVVIEGVDANSDTMEPCISLDGKYLFYNGYHKQDATAHVHWAKRIGELRFKHMGLVPGLQASGRDLVPTIDAHNNLYFNSNRSFGIDHRTVWVSQWSESKGATDLRSVGGDISDGCGPEAFGTQFTINMDTGISPDGNTLVLSRAHFVRGDGPPRASTLFVAQKHADGTFWKHPQSDALMSQVNEFPLQYAPAITADGLELYFTRVNPQHPETMETVVSLRRSVKEPFGKPRRLGAIQGFAEAPSLTMDKKELYFHKMDPGTKHFVIYRLTRQ